MASRKTEPRKYYQVRKNHISGWDLREQGSEIVIRHSSDKQKLIKLAETLCKTHDSELIIRDENGRILEKRTYLGDRG